MAGKRVQYLHPVKMYIFISLVYFLFLFNSASTADIVKVESKPMTAEQLAKLDQSITTNPGLSPQQKKDVLARIHGYKIVKKGAKTDTIHTYYNKIITDSGDTTYARYLSSQQKLPINNKDGFLKRLYYEKAFAWNKKGIDGKQLLKEDVKHDTPKMMFLLLPLFALLLKITFWKNKKYYVEHLIYSFHLHSFLFLFLTLIMLAQIVIPVNWHTVRDIMYWFATLSIIWYIYTSLRVVYHRTPARTIFKMIGLSFSYLMVFGLCMLFLLLIIVVTAV